MTLLKTIVLPNTLVAHGQNHLLAFQAGEVKRYRKSSDNTLVLLNTFALADVKRLTISEDGQCFAAQTSTHTHRLHMPESEPLAITGAMAISNSNYLLVLQPTAVQLFRESTVILTATTSSLDKVCCGLNGFVVYSGTRALTGTYTGVVLTNNAQAKNLLHVSHTGSDKFAYFYNDGTVTLSGTTRTLAVLKNHRNIGQHVLADDSAYEYAYIKSYPLTAPTKLRAWVEPPPPSEFFIFDTGGAPIGYTIQKTSGVYFDSPPQIGDASATLPHDNQDLITIVLDKAVDLSATDWTLEWSSVNTTAADGSYYAEIALLPESGNLGVVARYGDGGYGNRMQFGGLMNSTTNVWNVNFTKTSLNSVLKNCSLVKQGNTISFYLNGVRQQFALGTGTTYNQNVFSIDTTISAIKRVCVGAQPSGGKTMGAIRGPVKLSLTAKRPKVEVFSLFKPDGTLATGITNNGATVTNGMISVVNNQYLSYPADATMVPRTDDFVVEYEVLFAGVPATVSGTSFQAIFYWGNWANPAQPMNMEACYIHTSPTRTNLSISHAPAPPELYLSTPFTAALNQWYNFRWVRKGGTLTLFVDNVQISSTPFAYDVTYDTTQPLVIGRRRGGSSGEVYWYSNFKLRKLTITVG